MRMQTWMTAVAGTFMLLIAQTPTSGQMPSPDGSAAFYSPDGAMPAYPPGPYGGMPSHPQGAHCPPGYPPGMAGPGMAGAEAAAFYPPGAPGDMQPWPAISPFYAPNVAMDQEYNRDGLWFRELFYRRRDYIFSVEAMTMKFRDAGNATIGSPYARRINNNQDYPLGSFQRLRNFLNGPFVESLNVTPSPTGNWVIDPRVIPFPALAVSIFNDTADLDLYPVRTAADIGDPSVTPGLQLRWGYMNEDYTGFMLNGWYGLEQSADFIRGDEFINGVQINQAITTSLRGQNLSTQFGVIPLDNGEPLPGIPFFGTGSTAKYDLLYSMKFSTQAGGTNFSIYKQPLYKNGNVMLRPLFGARYMFINEAFQFRGIDSGFNYSIDFQPSTGGGTGGNQQAGQAGTLRPEPNTVVRLYDQYEAELNNRVNTHLAGPEVGLRLDLGNPREGFKIWSESIFGINVNNEDIHLYGDNIGDPLVDVRIRGFTIPRVLDDANFDSEFESNKNTTHVSPLAQQSIFLDFDLLETIPVIRDMSMFDDATFRLGYTLLWVGSVARPADSIEWQGFPLFPEIKNNRQSWWANQFSFAIDWHF